jgi:hypothetical protein
MFILKDNRERDLLRLVVRRLRRRHDKREALVALNFGGWIAHRFAVARQRSGLGQ